MGKWTLAKPRENSEESSYTKATVPCKYEVNMKYRIILQFEKAMENC